jgi:ADP-ribose pyrophosphatase YjhB (NUDIX family)
VTVWAGHADRGLLLVRPRAGADVWTTLVTCARAGESLDDAAIRCVRDGTALDPSIAGVYRVERVELRNRDDPGVPPLHDLTVHFDAVVDGVDPSPGPAVDAASFHATPPETVDRAVPSRFGDRDPRSALGLLEPA